MWGAGWSCGISCGPQEAWTSTGESINAQPLRLRFRALLNKGALDSWRSSPPVPRQSPPITVEKPNRIEKVIGGGKAVIGRDPIKSEA